jgi:hypothetical protein|tara:strand:+ start:1160 stop:1402 length:243 start_codon:yes stop_codon:yes gene_type:complete
MLENITSNLDVIISTITGVITVASILIAGTRTPAPDTMLGKIYKALEFLSLTVGKAKETGMTPVVAEEVPMVKGKTEKIK